MREKSFFQALAAQELDRGSRYSRHGANRLVLTFSDVKMLLEGSAYIEKSGFLVLAALPVTEFRLKVGDRFVIKR